MDERTGPIVTDGPLIHWLFQKPIMRVEPVQKGIVIQPLAGNRSSKYFKIMSLIMQLGAYSAYHVSKSRQGWFYKPYP